MSKLKMVVVSNGRVGQHHAESLLYKQRYSLASGQRLEEDANESIFNVSLEDNVAYIAA